jgi:2-polyprenyl-6-methoxyphenol 4-hydroxylase
MTLANNSDTKIAIVGGGMVGISLALFLSQSLSNVNIVLIEKFSFPQSSNNELPPVPELQTSFDARSTAISAGGASLLQRLGCWPLIKKHAEKIRSIHISDKGNFHGSQLLAEEYDVDALGYVVENTWLGQCLLYQLQQSNVECLAPAVVTQCHFKKDCVELSLEQHEIKQLNVNLVIAADGTDSPLCKMVGIDHVTKPYTQSALIANIALAEPHQGVAYERFTEEGPIALLPLEQCNNRHRSALVWTHPSDKVDAALALSDEQLLAVLQKTFGYRAGAFTAIGERQAYPLTQVVASEQARSRFVVAGNAAHFLHPVAGQGFNLSLRDGAVLAEVLSQAQQSGDDLACFDVLQRYIKQREQDQNITIGLTHSMVKMFSSDKKIFSLLRQFGLMNLNIHTSIKKAFVKQMMGFSS